MARAAVPKKPIDPMTSLFSSSLDGWQSDDTDFITNGAQIVIIDPEPGFPRPDLDAGNTARGRCFLQPFLLGGGLPTSSKREHLNSRRTARSAIATPSMVFAMQPSAQLVSPIMTTTLTRIRLIMPGESDSIGVPAGIIARVVFEDLMFSSAGYRRDS